MEFLVRSVGVDLPVLIGGDSSESLFWRQFRSPAVSAITPEFRLEILFFPQRDGVLDCIAELGAGRELRTGASAP